VVSGAEVFDSLKVRSSAGDRNDLPQCFCKLLQELKILVAGGGFEPPTFGYTPVFDRAAPFWWPGTESNGHGALKTDKLLIFQRPKKPKNLQKPIWRYIRGTRETANLVSTHQHLAEG